MIAFLELLDLLSLLLRALSLSLLTLCVGGLLFLLFVARDRDLAPSLRRWTQWPAIGLAVVELLRVALNSLVLNATTGATLRSLAATNYFQAGILSAVAGLATAVMLRRERPWRWVLVCGSAALVAAEVMTSHSAARLEQALWPEVMTGLHLAAAALWIGGLPYLLLAIRASGEEAGSQLVQRFSRVAIAGVALVAGSGIALSLIYIDSWSGVYGTAYGYMVATKILLLGLALLIGAANNRIVHALPRYAHRVLPSLRRLSEAEIGIGFTVILAAASLTSQPPATDLRNDRLTMAEIVDRFRPEVPRMTSPPVQMLSPASVLPSIGGSSGRLAEVPKATKNKEADIAWSEYNHHWAGAIVAAVGLLALIAGARPRSLARHWPVMWLALAVFIVLRADPENWPLGPRSFWQSFLVAEVAQHRFYALLIVLFALFEWRVQTGRIKSQWAALAFPAMCAVGGALLLTHTHPLGNLKDELLVEMSHNPIAIAGLTAGWARWLELRLPASGTGTAKRLLGWIWPLSLMTVGAILLLYREA